MTVVGLGVEGIDLVRYLSAEGALVTVSDARPAEALRESLAAISDTGATLSLGANRSDDISSADCVFVSQGVPRDLPPLLEARERGVPLSSMTRLFLDRCPAPVTGITGSAGKTTTVALVGAMLETAGINHVVGGNMGVGLLGLLNNINTDTQVIVELSHTQLESLERSPQLACITNIRPDHLDRYSWPSYVALKKRIFEFQNDRDTAIFNLDDDVSVDLAGGARGKVAYTSLSQTLPGDGVALDGETIVRHQDGVGHEVMSTTDIPLRGQHNVSNVLSALAIASHLGVTDSAAAQAVRRFVGVPHRLEPVATIRGALYVNDSISTTPERALAGIRSFDEPLVLLIGGRDKQLPMLEFATESVARCRAVITFGEASQLFAAAIREVRGNTDTLDGLPVVEVATDVESAVRLAAERATYGDVVLFSPAGTSFDAYPNFERRGEDFRQWVMALETERNFP